MTSADPHFVTDIRRIHAVVRKAADGGFAQRFTAGSRIHRRGAGVEYSHCQGRNVEHRVDRVMIGVKYYKVTYLTCSCGHRCMVLEREAPTTFGCLTRAWVQNEERLFEVTSPTGKTVRVVCDREEKRQMWRRIGQWERMMFTAAEMRTILRWAREES